MGVNYEKCGPDVIERVKKIIQQYHPDLAEVEVRLTLLFASAPKDDAGQPMRAAVTVGGYPSAAKTKIIGLKDRADGRADAEIIIDADQWDAMSDSQRDALLDHELYHLEVKRDKETNMPLSDDLGRPKLGMRKHDHQFGWFDEIARRHGDASFEVQQAKAFADEQGQTYFGWASPPDRDVESMRLVETA